MSGDVTSVRKEPRAVAEALLAARDIGAPDEIDVVALAYLYCGKFGH